MAWLGLTFYLLALIPVSGLFDNTFFAFSQVANHWWYPAMLGLLPIATASAAKLPFRCHQTLQILVILLLLGITGWENRRFHDPVYFYSRAAREHPDNVIAHHNLANLLLEQGKDDEALNHYLEAIRIHSNFWQARFQAGRLFSNDGRKKEAFDQFWAAHDIHPRHPDIHLQLGILYGEAGWHTNALAHLERSLQLFPDNPAAWVNFGTALFHAGQIDQAIWAFDKALQLDPHHPAALRYRAHAQSRKEPSIAPP